MPFIENDNFGDIMYNPIDNGAKAYIEPVLNFFNIKKSHQKTLYSVLFTMYLLMYIIGFIALCALLVFLYITKRLIFVCIQLIPIIILLCIHYLYKLNKQII